MKIRYPAIVTIVLMLLTYYLGNDPMIYAAYENWNTVVSVLLILTTVCFCYTIYLTLKAIGNKIKKIWKQTQEKP